MGVYESPTQFKGFLYSNGTFTTIDPAPSHYSGAQGINDLGEIVGTFVDTANKTHGFIYQSGTFTTFDAPGSIGTELYGVNRTGTVVGVAIVLKRKRNRLSCIRGYPTVKGKTFVDSTRRR